LEGPAAEVLKDFDDSTETAYEDLWKRIEHRFGDVDEGREAQRKFGNGRQTDSESLQEYEQALRTLYKQGWPTATFETRDAALKRKFEDGVASTELSQYLRLHHRKLTFEETVEQARLYTSTVEGTKGKKSVRFIAETDDDADGQTVILNHLRVSEKKLDQLERSRSRSKSPEKAVTGQRPTSRSPSPSVENRENREQPVKSSFPARRFDQTQGRRPWTPPPVRSFPFCSAGTTNQSQNIPRGTGQGCWTCGKLGCHSLLHGRNDRQTAMSPPRPARIQPPIQRVPNTPPRGKSGCYVCGRYGCYTIFHDDNGFETEGEDRGFPPLSASPTTVVRRGPQSGNDLRNPSTGTRAPQNP